MHRGVMFQYFEWYLPADGTLWRELSERAVELHNLGTTAIWLPPAYKGLGGANETGYGVYDLYDLGEFDQKGSVRTKYGTKDEYLAAIQAIQDAGMHVYADVVFNHRMGGDETEEVEIEEVSFEARHEIVSPPYKIRAWSRYNFPGRGEKYSAMKYRAEHFTAFGCNANAPEEKKIFKRVGKRFSDEVSSEFGNFDYLMGADVDMYHPEVREDLFAWGRWMIELTGVHGFRLDAVKHIPHSFFKDWLGHLREHFSEREVFAVAEYWSSELGELLQYLSDVEGATRLFDVPLHHNFFQASESGNSYDLRTIFDGTLVKDSPVHAVTFVDNHDTQPGQSLQSWVQDWFKPHAYALILLREAGYPCVFYGDYFGNPSEDHKLTSHRQLIDDMLDARKRYTFGEQIDYFDHPNCIGWAWTGDADNPGVMVVLMSNGDVGTKRIKTRRKKHTFRDITKHWPEPITTDDDGEAEFKCPAGQLSVWCSV